VSKISKNKLLKIAIIPARGGSKSIPRKNLQNLLGVPLIAYSIDCAIRSHLVDEVYVSTEDVEIADISRAYGAKVIIRPDSMASDISRDNELLSHAIEHVFSELSEESLFVFLRPSHPLRNPATIDKAIELFNNNSQYDSLRSMKLSKEIPYKTWTIDSDGSAKPVIETACNGVADPSNAPRQLLPPTYYQDGYVDIFPFKTITKFNNTAGRKVLPFVINDFSHDIDTLHDIEIINKQLENFPWPLWFRAPNPIL
jgi:CMP-N-acetylneuraminic acid synthetase